MNDATQDGEIAMIMGKTGASFAAAVQALEDKGGDLDEAMELINNSKDSKRPTMKSATKKATHKKSQRMEDDFDDYTTAKPGRQESSPTSKRAGYVKGKMDTQEDGKTTGPNQSEQEYSSSTTPSSSLLMAAMANSNTSRRGVTPPRPRPTPPGAVAVTGPDPTNVDGSNDDFSYTAQSHGLADVNVSTPSPSFANPMTPVTARIVHGNEEDVEALQEQLRQQNEQLQQVQRFIDAQQNVAVAQVIEAQHDNNVMEQEEGIAGGDEEAQSIASEGYSSCLCEPTRKRKWVIGGAIVVLIAAIVVGVVVATSFGGSPAQTSPNSATVGAPPPPPAPGQNTTARHSTMRTLFSQIQGNEDDVSLKYDESLKDELSIKKGEDASIKDDMSIMAGPNPCDRIDFRVTDDPEEYHSVGAGMEKYHQMATALSNPEYKRNHHDDDSALVYIAKHCGPEAAAAYSCITPPAYRADIFRFCALFAEGGVYLDEDMLPVVPLDDLYSPCAVATLGHDSPQNGHPGKQMKILAGQPGAEIFQCALERSVDNINNRRYPRRGPLALTGPLLLHDCYEMHSDSVAVVYHDSRNAKWPYTGKRGGNKILAVELPRNAKHCDGSGVELDPGDYGDLFMARKIYRETCVPDDFIFPSIKERIEYYMGSWWYGDTMDRAPYMCGDVHWFNYREKRYHSDRIRVSDGEQWLTYGPNLYELEGLDDSSVHYYLRDSKRYLSSAWHGGKKLRFLMHFGDTVNYYDLPVVVKTRPLRAWKEDLSYPIIAPLEIWRHFDSIALVPGQDTGWHDKSASLVWRGVSTGSRANTIDQIFDRFYPEYVDVGITELVQGDEKIDRFKRLLKPALTMKEQLTFKYILSLEGNDVASGLKWQLYSNSVVFMPRPSRVSWAMEDQLLPYYHYIPLEDDLSDIYEKLEWARQNDALCQRIAQHATEYIEFLWVGERAQQDTKRVLEGMVGKYQQLFGDSLEKCAGESR